MSTVSKCALNGAPLVIVIAATAFSHYKSQMKYLLYALSLWSVAIASAAEPEAVELSPKFVEGQTLKFEVTQLQKITVGGETSTGKFWTEFEFTVAKVGENGARVEIRYVNVAAEILRGNEAMKFDSRVRDEGSKELGLAVMDIVGKQVTAIFDTTGRIVKVEGLEKLKESVGGKSFGGVFDDEIFRRSFSKVFMPVPDKGSLAVGSAHTAYETSNLDSGTRLVVALEHKLTSVDEKDAVINITGDAKLTPLPPLEKLPEGGRLGEQSIKGTIVWDRGARVIRRYDLRSLLVFVRKMPDGRAAEMITESRTSTVRTTP
jgi:hypothetical protein